MGKLLVRVNEKSNYKYQISQLNDNSKRKIEMYRKGFTEKEILLLRYLPFNFYEFEVKNYLGLSEDQFQMTTESVLKKTKTKNNLELILYLFNKSTLNMLDYLPKSVSKNAIESVEKIYEKQQKKATADALFFKIKILIIDFISKTLKEENDLFSKNFSLNEDELRLLKFWLTHKSMSFIQEKMKLNNQELYELENNLMNHLKAKNIYNSLLNYSFLVFKSNLDEVVSHYNISIGQTAKKIYDLRYDFKNNTNENKAIIFNELKELFAFIIFSQLEKSENSDLLMNFKFNN